MDTTPIPRDIPLPLPADSVFLQILLIVSFVAHILFVNLMVGGSLLVFFYQLRGLRKPVYDALAHEIARTLTVNKSLAVVLGVAPLLLINVLYTVYFYTANALTGVAWILIIPLVAIAFLLLYLHKYSWERMAHLRGLHIGIMGFVVMLFLFIPLIFLANINLMLFPNHWGTIKGFVSALTLPSIFPRYIHFLSASLILTSLFGVYYFGRAGFPVEERLAPLTRPQLRREFYSIAFLVSIAQFIIGPLVMITLPAAGKSGTMMAIILLGAFNAIPAVWLMWKELARPEPHGRFVLPILVILCATVLAMAMGRHAYRETALANHKQEMAAATALWESASLQAAYDVEHGLVRVKGPGKPGQSDFEANCMACHALDTQLVGPPLREIATIYNGKPEGIAAWAMAPGKKRADFPQMPGFERLGEEKLRQIAEYILKATQPQP